MLGTLLGLTVLREIPVETLAGLATGMYSLHGGVVRDTAGRIVAHLALPAEVGMSFTPGVGNLVNTLQLVGISQQVQQVLSVSLLNTALSGLGLVTSFVGFAVLTAKINDISTRLKSVQKDVKDVKRILQSQSLAQLLNAIDRLERSVGSADAETRRQMLIRYQGTLGELAHHYKAELEAKPAVVANLPELEAEEGYFAQACLGSVLCSSALGLSDAASADMTRHYQDWSAISRRRCATMLELDKPDGRVRLLDPQYVKSLPTKDLVDLLDYAHPGQAPRGIDWIDELRGSLGKTTMFTSAMRRVDEPCIDYALKLRARDEVLQSYQAHFAFLAERKISADDFARGLEEMRVQEGAPLLYVAA